MMRTISACRLPDLAELESVEAGASALLLAAACYGGFALWLAVLAVWGALRYREFMGTLGLAAAGAIALLTAWVVLRLLTAPVRIRSDSGGLTLRSVLRTSTIPWMEVSEASAVSSRRGKGVLVLNTTRGTVKLRPENCGGSSSFACLVASTWQHLRRLGRAELIELPESALSLWQAIEDDIPRAAEWGMAPSRAAKAYTGVILAVFIACLVSPWALCSPSWPQIVMPILAALLLAVALSGFLIPDMLRTARRARIDDHGLEADLVFSRVDIAWFEVSSAHWLRNALVIRTSDPHREVRLPHALGSKESERFMLAVVRNLRSVLLSLPVTLPQTISADSDLLKQPAYTPQQMQALQSAFLNTLEAPVRRRVTALHRMCLSLAMTGLLLGAAAALVNLPGLLSRALHSLADQNLVFFFPDHALALAVPYMMAGCMLGGLVGKWIAAKRAGKALEAWRGFDRLGASRFTTGVAVVGVVVSVGGILLTPVLMDHYLKVTHLRVSINHLWEFHERHYPWKAMRSVRLLTKHATTDGSSRIQHECVLTLADGTEWTLRDTNPADLSRDDVVKAAEFIARKSGTRIDYR